MSSMTGEGIHGIPSTLSSAQTIQAGGGTATVKIGGVLDTNTTEFTTAGTSQETAYTLTIPANTLNKNNDMLRIKVYLQTAANANSKTMQVFYGSSLIQGVTATYNNFGVEFYIDLIRTGVGTQTSFKSGQSGASNLSISTLDITEDETTDLDLTVKFTTPTLAGDATFKGITVEYLPAP